jgi:dephospho-CoA kinase
VTILVFGLTGGIGSGKSTVAARFRERGLPVIDADELAREVVSKGTEGLAEIVEAFGPAVLDANGELDRPKLAEIVFGDEAKRRRLNAITHPRVRELSQERIAEQDAKGEPLACYEVPLLVESGLADVLRPLVVVSVDEATQFARTTARDGSTEEHAKKRVRSQLPLAEKAKLADYVIDNSGSIQSTRARADEVLDAICASLGIDKGRFPSQR